MVLVSLPPTLYRENTDIEKGKENRTHPSFRRSMKFGNVAWQYVDVQMSSRTTRRRDWKLKIAVCSSVTRVKLACDLRAK